jgi:hypothetical protein
MKFKLIPKSNQKIESKLAWRFFKVIYFVVGSIGGGLVYSLINSWYYTNCPLTNLPWEEKKLLCTKYFAWGEFLLSVILILLILRIIFPFIEKLVMYVLFDNKKT